MLSTPAFPTLPHDLTHSEAQQRLQQFGKNEIAHLPRASATKIFLSQFYNPMVLLLLVGVGVSLFLKELVDATAIFAILMINAAVGFFQEYRAERALDALRSLTAPRARVRRDGVIVEVAATDIVPDDLLLLEEGDVVAADATLFEAHALQLNEATLTGESLPVEKVVAPALEHSQNNKVFASTIVVHGTGQARVTHTGMSTEIGKVAHLLATVPDEAAPLQKRLARTTQKLIYASLVIVGVIALFSLTQNMSWADILLGTVSLSIAAIPEGLPAIITITLALGVQRLAKHNVLIRKLAATETLGCTTVVCTDKTGTLTTGVMSVREVWGRDHKTILYTAAACCDAEIKGSHESGDPTELAILRHATTFGIFREDIENNNPRIDVVPFDSLKKHMSIRRRDGVLYVKGAFEAVRSMCGRIPADSELAHSQMADRALRILAIARGLSPQQLELVGLIGLADPPRPEAIHALAAAKKAGITTVLITGDHPVTAQAIAREMKLITHDTEAHTLVHARANPEDKLRIIAQWKKRGAIVAMTGDGVNDAPALREAHVGIAMGKSGTEVAREAADVVLSDDNYASIVAGIREGRGIFENIRTTIMSLLIGNVAELLVMFVAALAAMPVPFLPLQLLWINLVTDSFPALALATEKPGPHIMEKPPRSPQEELLRRREWLQVGAFAIVEAAVVLTSFFWALDNLDLTQAREVAFATLIFAEVYRPFAMRDSDYLSFEKGFFGNRFLLLTIVVSTVVQGMLLQQPHFLKLFDLEPLAWPVLVGCWAMGLVSGTLIEALKLARRLAPNQLSASSAA